MNGSISRQRRAFLGGFVIVLLVLLAIGHRWSPEEAPASAPGVASQAASVAAPYADAASEPAAALPELEEELADPAGIVASRVSSGEVSSAGPSALVSSAPPMGGTTAPSKRPLNAPEVAAASPPTPDPAGVLGEAQRPRLVRLIKPLPPSPAVPEEDAASARLPATNAPVASPTAPGGAGGVGGAEGDEGDGVVKPASPPASAETIPPAVSATAPAEEAAGAAVPPGAEPVRVYAWRATDEPFLHDALLLSGDERGGPLLARALKAWAGLAPDQRCVMVAPYEIFQSPPLDAAAIDALVIHGPDLSAMEAWWRDVLWTLERNDLRPARVALDWESGLSYWQRLKDGDADAADAAFGPAWRNPDAFALLPPALQAIEPGELHFLHNRGAVIAWGQLAKDLLDRSLRRAFVEPLHDTFPGVPVTNWQDAWATDEMLDDNGWPFARGGVGDESSQAVYAADTAAMRVLLQATVGGGGAGTVPWVCFPSFSGNRAAWAETVRDAYRLGVREFLYWNPDLDNKPDDDDAFAATVFSGLEARPETSFD